jgi:predicted membrane protein
MGIIGRVVGLAFIGLAGTMAVGAAAALNAKQRIVPTTDPTADDITVASIFGPLAYKSTSKHFTGGTVECWYGGGALDLRDAVLAPEGATLRLKAVFGGGQILVPATWPVVTHVTGVGGIQDSRPAAGSAEGAPTLTIEGTVVFGGMLPRRSWRSRSCLSSTSSCDA